VAKEWLGWPVSWVLELPSTEVVLMRAFLRVQNRDQTWAYVERKKKELYIRIAVKKLSEDDDEFQYLNPVKQLETIVDRAKQIAMDAANDENEFLPLDPEGNVLDEEGRIDPDAKSPQQPARFGDGSAAEIGETREKGRHAGIAQPKTFGR
jgi:hypothetical protein